MRKEFHKLLLKLICWVIFTGCCFTLRVPWTHSQGKLLANPAEAQEDCQSNHLICRLCLSERISWWHELSGLACSFFPWPPSTFYKLNVTERVQSVIHEFGVLFCFKGTIMFMPASRCTWWLKSKCTMAFPYWILCRSYNSCNFFCSLPLSS